MIPSLLQLTPATAIVHWNDQAGVHQGSLETFLKVKAEDVLGLNLSHQGLTTARFGDLPNCRTLDVTNNFLTDLRVNHLTSLESLKCATNNIGRLPVRRLTRLAQLDAAENKLARLLLGGLEELLSLAAYTMPGVCPDVSVLTKLKHVDLGQNFLSVARMNVLVRRLNLNGVLRGKLICFGNSSPTRFKDVAALGAKGWRTELNGYTLNGRRA